MLTNNNPKINVCLSCDENYAQYAGVVIASILANAKAKDNLHFYILDGNISNDSKEKILSLKYIKDCEIEFIQVNEQDFEDYKNIPNHNYITISTYYRLKLASLIPDVDKIIYLDCDVIVCSSLAVLFNTNLQENIFGGVWDIDLRLRNNPKYVNAGVLLMDLNKIREQGIESIFLEYAQQNWQNIQLGDQGIINDVLKGKILNIDERYNVQSECFIRRSSFTKNPVIIHYIGSQKPWHFGSWSVHKDLYFRYLQMTPWRLSDKELKKWGLQNKIYSFYKWFCHRPFFYLQPKFWRAFKNDRNANDRQKTFVVILMACFGDVILCNSLFQNIKRLYPDSKTVFVVDKPWYEAAKYQPCVDEVIVFDKRGENKGLFGLLKFIRNFPYKKIDYVFKIYDNQRVDLISWLLHPAKILGKPYDGTVKVQHRHCNLLTKITDEKIINCPIKYVADKKIPPKFQGFLSQDKKYVALCTTTKQDEKDMPLNIAVELIEKLNADGYEVLFVGSGDKADKYAQELIKNGAEFVNLVNQTSIYELAQVLRCSEGTISVDTGTMHFSYANDVPTLCLFYKESNVISWAPDKNLYPHTIVVNNFTAGITITIGKKMLKISASEKKLFEGVCQ